MPVTKATAVTPPRVRLGPFGKFNCDGVWYEFSVPLDLFDLDLFVETTKLPEVRAKWSAVCASKSALSDYHVHFDGQVRAKKIYFRVYYAEGAVRASANEQEPFAESIMAWMGKFFKKQTSDVSVRASFRKSDDEWRGCFNLPFKVTMSGQGTEVTIDGVSFALPKSGSGAYEGSLKKQPGRLLVSVKLNRKVVFARFSLRDEINAFEDVTKLWIERIEP